MQSFPLISRPTPIMDIPALANFLVPADIDTIAKKVSVRAGTSVANVVKYIKHYPAIVSGIPMTCYLYSVEFANGDVTALVSVRIHEGTPYIELGSLYGAISDVLYNGVKIGTLHPSVAFPVS